ncbi:MAG: hypothetical protein JRI46_06015 [Deltaproteobacteria bacterium]|nr:hypothetical protein [Deltaproteobacteria bacterium]
MAERDRRTEDKRLKLLSDFHQELIRNLYDYQLNFTQLLVAVTVDGKTSKIKRLLSKGVFTVFKKKLLSKR